MNIPHKCHFHPNNYISKFCSNQQCTLPLCFQCESIHLEQHHAQHTEGKILRFNQAYLHASNAIQDYVESQKRYFKEQQNRIDNDVQMISKMIDQYYSIARKKLQEEKKIAFEMQDRLNKLKKGSIKTLIFYYSGDIQFKKLEMNFDVLFPKLKKVIDVRPNDEDFKRQNEYNEPRFDHSKEIQRKRQIQEIKSMTTLSHAPNMPPSQNLYSMHEQMAYSPIKNYTQQGNRSKSIDTGNVFAKIQEIKDQKTREKNRKSIFQQKKPSNTTSQNTLKSNQPQLTIHNHQERYYENYPKENNRQEHNPKYHYQTNFTKNNEEKQINIKMKNDNEFIDAPISFQNRYKFTEGNNNTDYSERMKNQNLGRNFNNDKDIKKTQDTLNTIHKILKPSDLQLQKPQAALNKNTSNQYDYGLNGLTQRNRAYSQTNIMDKENRKGNYDLDLKKQVLSPEEIRKMLEKRIEERNRILSIKKNDNYQPTKVQEKNSTKKAWQTKDSIINHIYGDTKY